MALVDAPLGEAYFGNELARLRLGTAATVKTLTALRDFAGLDARDWGRVRLIVDGFFSRRVRGQFGGPITAGDGFFIAAFLAGLRPMAMLEVGVCSGVSSAFILYAAHKLGLVRDGRAFLTSIDLLALHGPDKLEVGRVVRLNYPSLLPYWRLHVGVTAPQVALGEAAELGSEIAASRATLAFIDANHAHPWPLADALAVQRMLPAGSWMLMQDAQLMERWLGHRIERGVPVPKPCRGVNLIASLWPGDKVIGWDICYNMAALKVPLEGIASLRSQAMAYPRECSAAEARRAECYISALA